MELIGPVGWNPKFECRRYQLYMIMRYVTCVYAQFELNRSRCLLKLLISIHTNLQIYNSSRTFIPGLLIVSKFGFVNIFLRKLKTLYLEFYLSKYLTLVPCIILYSDSDVNWLNTTKLLLRFQLILKNSFVFTKFP